MIFISSRRDDAIRRRFSADGSLARVLKHPRESASLRDFWGMWAGPSTEVLGWTLGAPAGLTDQLLREGLLRTYG